MFCSKIFVSYDGSEPAKKSLEKAIELGKLDKNISIHVATIIMLESIPNEGPEVTDSIVANAEATMEEIKKALANVQNETTVIVLKGLSIPDIILNYADEHHCDLIIMGSRGLTGIKEFLGSVSSVVVPRAQVPVLIVK